MIKIKICDDFSDIPGGRYISEGDFSGELFRESILLKKDHEAVERNTELEIDFDGCYGYPSSFLDEAFGGLARKLRDKSILENMELICNDEPGIIEDIKEYVSETQI